MFKLFLFCVFIPAVLSQCNIKKVQHSFKRSVYEFSVDLIKRLSEENDHHFVTSPLSMWTMLALVSIGASDNTRSEIKQVLRLHNNACFNKKYLEIARLSSSGNKTDVFLERSSVIFADSILPVKRKFEEDVIKSGVSHIERFNAENIDNTVSIINDYVRRATHESIDEIVTPSDVEDMVLMIVDAIFFKGLWQSPFDIAYTTVSEFYNENGNQIGEVNLMSLMDTFKAANVNPLNATVLELPYGDGNSYSMLIFLPYKDVSLNSVIQKLKQISLTSLKAIFEKNKAMFGDEAVAVSLPRFKLTSDLNNLKELLIDMGLTTVFDEYEARFPYISDQPLRLSNIVQKADIEVSEDGTTASAASGAGFVSRMSPRQFNAVKPFLFMIIDKEFEIPIFAGAYSKPSL